MGDGSIFLVWPGAALIAGLMARSLGRNPWRWFVAGILTGPFAPLVALLVAVMPRARA